MKQTRQKTLILNSLMNREDHPTAEMIYQELREVDAHLSLATVYRNLNTFALKGKIRKIELPNMKDRFDWNLNAHDHALCTRCAKLMDVPSRYPHKKHSMIHGFKVSEVELLYKGICEECQNQQKQGE